MFFEGIEYESDSWLFWYETGNLLFKLKNYKQCIYCFKICNIINKKDIHSWIMLSICYLNIKQYKMAIKIMQFISKFNKNHISKNDKLLIQNGGQQLINVGYIENGKIFQNLVL